MQSVTSHGTEGRFLALASPQPEKEVAADYGVIHSQKRFLKSDIKDLHIHETAAAVTDSPPSLSKHEMEVADLKIQVCASNDKIAALERQIRSITSGLSSVAENPNNSATVGLGLGLSTGGNECVICLDGPKTIVLFPCKHLCLCSKCSVGGILKACPICMEEVQYMFDIVPT